MTMPFVARCAGGTEIDLPNSVQSIGTDAIYACKKLTEITLPTSLRYIGTDAFALCNSLSKVHITNHTAGEWNTVVEPTETACGEKQIVCTVCGEVLERETIAMPEKTEESIDTVSEETSEEVRDEVSAEISETTSMQTSLALTSSAPPESTAPAPQRGGVPVWAVILIALCTAACGVGGTYLVIKKK